MKKMIPQPSWEEVVRRFFDGRSAKSISIATAVLMSDAEHTHKIRQLLGMTDGLDPGDIYCDLPSEKDGDIVGAVIGATVFSFPNEVDFIALALRNRFDCHLDDYAPSDLPDGLTTRQVQIFRDGVVVGLFRGVTMGESNGGEPFGHDKALLDLVYHVLWRNWPDSGFSDKLAGELSNKVSFYTKNPSDSRRSALGDRIGGVGNSLEKWSEELELTITDPKYGDVFPCRAAEQLFFDLYLKSTVHVSLSKRCALLGQELFATVR